MRRNRPSSAWLEVKQVVMPTARRLALKLDRREPVHFLHIGKAAGTQVGLIAEQINRQSDHLRIITHGHQVRLKDLPSGERYFFSVRDPASRFVSGFYSRKRKGQPRIHAEWTAYERASFERFEHANDLAESIFEPGDPGLHAFCAMKSITHTAMDQVDWFQSTGYFFEVDPPVWILRQESFSDDLGNFMEALGCQSLPISPSSNAVSAHRNDYSSIPQLSAKARANLSRWYAQDFEFYARCVAWIERRRRAAPET